MSRTQKKRKGALSRGASAENFSTVSVGSASSDLVESTLSRGTFCETSEIANVQSVDALDPVVIPNYSRPKASSTHAWQMVFALKSLSLSSLLQITQCGRLASSCISFRFALGSVVVIFFSLSA